MKNKYRFPPTERQQMLLDFIRKYIGEHDGVAPSFTDMCAGTGITSRGSVHQMLRALEERGWIARLPGRNRAIILTDDAFVHVTE